MEEERLVKRLYKATAEDMEERSERVIGGGGGLSKMEGMVLTMEAGGRTV